MATEIMIFETKDNEIKLTVPVENETVWLTQAQMTELFQVDRTVITRHVNNVFKENELLRKSNVQKMHIPNSDRPVQFYSLEVIISVGYRVKSNRGVEFRQWANSVLKQYIMQGYAINEKRLAALQRTVDIQTKMLASTLEVDEAELLKAVNLYTNALMLLDQYDHQSIKKPTGNKAIYRITYEDCRNMVNEMEDSFHSDVFGLKKKKEKLKAFLQQFIKVRLAKMRTLL